jgi:hypothetical protein
MSTDETKFIGFRASEEFSEAAKKRAKQQHRSLAGYLRYLIEQDIQGSGVIMEDSPKYGSPIKDEIALTARSSSPITYPKKTRRK